MGTMTMAGLGLIGTALLCFGWIAGWFGAVYYLTHHPAALHNALVRTEARRRKRNRGNHRHVGPGI